MSPAQGSSHFENSPPLPVLLHGSGLSREPHIFSQLNGTGLSREPRWYCCIRLCIRLSIPFDYTYSSLSMVHSALSPPSLRASSSLLIMASQDYISQFTQGIPATQPERSPPRTPRRDHPSKAYGASVPAYRGPLHMATQQCRNPCFGYTHTWTPPRLTTMPPSTSPSPMPWNYMAPSPPSVQPLFPPVPPTYSPPPPPPPGSTTPQRFTTTSPKSHSSTPPASMSQIHKGYTLYAHARSQLCHIGNRTWVSTTPERPMELTSRPQYVPPNSRSTRTSKGWTLYKFPSGNSSTKV